MAETITAGEIGQTQAFALSATAGVATEVTLDENVRRVEIEFKSGAANAAGKYSHTGTDAVAIGADAFPVDAGLARDIVVAGKGRNLGGTVLYFAGDVVSATLHIIAWAE